MFEKTADKLKAFTNFHDWNIDAISVNGRDLIIGLRYDDKRAALTFEQTTRCSVQRFSIVNVVFDVEVLAEGSVEWEKALATLADCERLLRAVQPNGIVLITSSIGAEIVVEFVTLKIDQ